MQWVQLYTGAQINFGGLPPYFNLCLEATRTPYVALALTSRFSNSLIQVLALAPATALKPRNALSQFRLNRHLFFKRPPKKEPSNTQYPITTRMLTCGPTPILLGNIYIISILSQYPPQNKCQVEANSIIYNFTTIPQNFLLLLFYFKSAQLFSLVNGWK